MGDGAVQSRRPRCIKPCAESPVSGPLLGCFPAGSPLAGDAECSLGLWMGVLAECSGVLQSRRGWVERLGMGGVGLGMRGLGDPAEPA